MSKTEQTLTEAVREAASRARRDLGEHPPPEVLLDYDAGELPGAEMERVRRHLVLCHRCAREVLALAALPEGPPRDPEMRLGAEEEEALWRRVTSHLEPPRPGQRPAPRVRAVRRRERRRLPVGLYPAAAALIAACAGLAFWGLGLRQEVRQLSAPRGDVHVVEVRPEALPAQRGGGTVLVPAGMGRVVLELVATDLRPFERYRAEVREGSAQGLLRWDGRLVRDPEGGFHLELSRADLPTGRYRIEVRGITGGREEILDTYDLRVEYAE